MRLHAAGHPHGQRRGLQGGGLRPRRRRPGQAVPGRPLRPPGAGLRPGAFPPAVCMSPNTRDPLELAFDPVRWRSLPVLARHRLFAHVLYPGGPLDPWSWPPTRCAAFPITFVDVGFSCMQSPSAHVLHPGLALQPPGAGLRPVRCVPSQFPHATASLPMCCTRAAPSTPWSWPPTRCAAFPIMFVDVGFSCMQSPSAHVLHPGLALQPPGAGLRPGALAFPPGSRMPPPLCPCAVPGRPLRPPGAGLRPGARRSLHCYRSMVLAACSHPVSLCWSRAAPPTPRSWPPTRCAPFPPAARMPPPLCPC